MTAIRDLTDTDALRARYERLMVLQRELEAEIVAVTNGLRVAGLMPAGRPRIAPTHTADEARAAHAAYSRGHRDDWTVDGERQYQRDRKRVVRMCPSPQEEPS